MLRRHPRARLPVAHVRLLLVQDIWVQVALRVAVVGPVACRVLAALLRLGRRRKVLLHLLDLWVVGVGLAAFLPRLLGAVMLLLQAKWGGLGCLDQAPLLLHLRLLVHDPLLVDAVGLRVQGGLCVRDVMLELVQVMPVSQLSCLLLLLLLYVQVVAMKVAHSLSGGVLKRRQVLLSCLAGLIRDRNLRVALNFGLPQNWRHKIAGGE